MKLNLTWFALLFVSSAICQDNFLNGFIVRNSGDTVRGFLKADIEERLSKQIVFKVPNGLTETMMPGDIQSFGFDNERVFRVVSYTDPTENYEKKTHFAKLLLDGNNDLYSFIKKDNFYFVVKTKEDTTFLLYDDLTSAIGTIIEKGNYRHQLFFIGRQCEPMRSRAEKVNFTEIAIVTYFIELEKCVWDNSASVFYKKPKLDKHIYLFAGGMVLGEKNQITAHAIIKFMLSSQSTKTSLNTGFIYLRNFQIGTYQVYFNRIVEFDRLTEIFEVPLMIHYDLLEKKIRPYFYGGLGLAYKNENPVPGIPENGNQERHFGVTLIAGAGIEAWFSSRLGAKIDWRYDLLFHLPALGIVYKFK